MPLNRGRARYAVWTWAWTEDELLSSRGRPPSSVASAGSLPAMAAYQGTLLSLRPSDAVALTQVARALATTAEDRAAVRAAFGVRGG